MSSYIGNKKTEKIFIGGKEVLMIFNGTNEVYSSGPNADPILNNNDWATIRTVCEAGEAANYWSLGDTKTDIGSDGSTRIFRIADMQGLYGKHVVFEQVKTENDVFDSDNNYSISPMRTTHLPAIMMRYSNELQSELTNTTYKVAENGNSSTILELTDKLFLAAEKEVRVGTYYNSVEAAELTTFQYYVINNANDYRKKTAISGDDSSSWWLRTPYGGRSAVYVKQDGGFYFTVAYGFNRVGPVFSF